MTYPKPAYVIGGCADGKRLTSMHGKTMAVPVRQPVPEFFDAAMATTTTASIQRYRPWPHGIGGQKFCVWVPEEWTDDQASAEVFERIAKAWAERIKG